MLTALSLFHVIICVLLIGLVLLQDPKSSGGGGMFGGGGGGGGSLLGATGAATFLTRLTRYSAVIFGVTCLILTLMSRPNTGSVIDSAPTSIPTGAAEKVPGAPDASAPTSTNTGGATQTTPGAAAPGAATTAPAASAPATAPAAPAPAAK